MISAKLKLLFQAIVSISLLAYLIYILDWGVVESLEKEMLFVIAGGSVIFLGALSLMSFRWKLILEHELPDNVSFFLLLRFYVEAMFFNIFLPGSVGGDAMRASLVNNKYNLGFSRSIAVVVSERFFGLAGLAFIVSIGFLLNQDLLFKLELGYKTCAFLAMCSVIGFFVARYLATKKAHVTLAMSISLLMISIAGQMGDVLITYLLTLYFDLNVSFSNLLILMPVVYIVTILPISIGGIGVREGVMVGMLALFSVDSSIAIIIALSLYLTKILVGMIGAVLYLQDQSTLSEDQKDSL